MKIKKILTTSLISNWKYERNITFNLNLFIINKKQKHTSQNHGSQILAP